MILYVSNNDAYPFMETSFTSCGTLQEAEDLFKKDLLDTLRASSMEEALASLAEDDTLEDGYASVKNGKGEVITLLIKEF